MPAPDVSQPVATEAGHVEGTVRSIAQLRAEHERQSSPLQRAVDRLTGFFGRPGMALAVTLFVAVWIGGNTLILFAGGKPLDPPPFFWLEGGLTLASLYLVILVLASQRREDELEQRRELLGLELAILSEKKAAKIIELLEELRRDSPEVADRVDREADQLSTPADPDSVLNVIRDADISGAEKPPATP